MQPSVDFLLAIPEDPQGACIFGKCIPLGACTADNGTPILDDEFNTIASFQAETFPNRLGTVTCPLLVTTPA